VSDWGGRDKYSVQSIDTVNASAKGFDSRCHELALGAGRPFVSGMKSQ
jgi:hypothetical protein